MAKLWEKDYQLDKVIEVFTVGSDYTLDLDLINADCAASMAHATMLASLGILSPQEVSLIKQGLVKVLTLNSEDKFTITVEDEDGQTALENFLVREIGEAGKKVHTGRSRSDQVLVALRLYARSFILDFTAAATRLVRSLIDFATLHAKVPMAGRTHMQLAMPSSVGLWAGAYAEALADCLLLLQDIYRLINKNPLGSAASYGVPLPLNRELVAKLLGFAGVQNNVLYTHMSRGTFESLILDNLEHAMLYLGRLADELIIYSLPEFGYFSLPSQLCTGSSIMPQKKNPDALELLRAKVSLVSACAGQIKGILKNLASGYCRDLQDTKEPFMRGINTALASVMVMDLTVKNLKVAADKLVAGFRPEIFATDEALRLVAGGMAFRDAYREVGLNLEKLPGQDAAGSIASRSYPGTSGNLNLAPTEKICTDLEGFAASETAKIDKRTKQLLGASVPFFKAAL